VETIAPVRLGVAELRERELVEAERRVDVGHADRDVVEDVGHATILAAMSFGPFRGRYA